jgi:hypothetical protein
MRFSRNDRSNFQWLDHPPDLRAVGADGFSKPVSIGTPIVEIFA